MSSFINLYLLFALLVAGEYYVLFMNNNLFSSKLFEYKTETNI